MGDIKITNNFGTPVVNNGGFVVINNSVEEALRLKARIDAMNRQGEAADADETHYEEIKTETIPSGERHVLPQQITDAPSRTFRQDSEFVREKLRNAVMRHYQGQPSNLAYIAAVADDYGLLAKRNACLDFVRSCIAVGAIDYVDDKTVENISNGMSKKLRGQKRKTGNTPALETDFRSWTSSADKQKCELIAKEFEGLGMKYKYR